MKKTFPFILILNSIFFIAGMYAIVYDNTLLCTLCLSSISLLFIWMYRPRRKADAASTIDGGAGKDSANIGSVSIGGVNNNNANIVSANNRADDKKLSELSLRIQELTETNQTLNEEIERLRNEQNACQHPLYSCPLTSSLPINLNNFFAAYIKNRFDTVKSDRIRPEYYCSIPDAETYLSAAALNIICDNVVDNMLKFSPVSADIYTTLYIRITDMEGDSLIIFRNNGDGISEHETSLIFDLNYQGSNKTVGNGLGLAQVNAIVSDYGGRIWAASSRSTGFTLYIQLPAKQTSQIPREDHT